MLNYRNVVIVIVGNRLGFRGQWGDGLQAGGWVRGGVGCGEKGAG